MNIEREIHILQAELNQKGDIPCVLLGRAVRATECCSRGLQATVAEFQSCRACARGHELAATSPLSPRNLLPLAELPEWAKALPPRRPVSDHFDREDKMVDLRVARLLAYARPVPVVAAPAGEPAPKPAASRGPRTPRLKRQAEPVISEPRKTMPARLLDMRDIGIEAVGRQMRAERQSAKSMSATTPRAPRREKPMVRCRKCGWPKSRGITWPEPDLCPSCVPTPLPVRPKYLEKAAVARAARKPKAEPEQLLLPNCPCMDQRLVWLASALRELTADGRMRVSMLDIMRATGAANYDEAHSWVQMAGLRTSKLFGPVQAVLVDHNVRQLLERAPKGGVQA